jgi:bifunctional UDP-N-acetylglucosamine pyrophosphorylase/glucosamine-1-phosphate N-acetyltransferase
MASLSIIILAAGNGVRLKSQIPKVMHPIGGRPMIDYVLQVARKLKPKKIAIVLGYGAPEIRAHLGRNKGVYFAHQAKRLGTAHAAQVGLKALGKVSGEVLILNGDVPLLQVETLKQFLQIKNPGSVSMVTALLPNPTGYGRILRDEMGEVLGIVEENNATAAEREINEINAGIYRVDSDFLRKNLNRIKMDSKKREYFLTDLVALARSEGKEVTGWTLEDAQQILGANTRAELAYLNQRVQEVLVRKFLTLGVGMEDPDHIYLDHGVQIGADSFLGVGVQIRGDSRIGKKVTIESGSILKNVQVSDGVQILAYSYLENCRVQKNAVVGPFARLRPGTEIGEGSKVGNFVEMKKTRLGKDSKANHLSYLGDCRIGQGVNIGAGTITCNYDGKKKFQTVIMDGSFIGSDTQLVAPVKVGRGAYVGSGTTLTQDVPPGALALSRVPQKNIRGWAKRRKGNRD